MSSYQRLLVQRTQISDGAIYSKKLGLSIQTGTGSAVAATGYLSFATAFGTPPALDIYAVGTARIRAGSYQVSVSRVTAGSFAVRGTPITRLQWRAEGFLDTGGN